MHSRSSDPLAALITLLRPQAVLSKIVSGAGRWSVRYPPHEHPGFCLMLEGSCFLDADGVGSFELHAGDFVLLPAVPAFTLASDLSITPTPVRPSHRPELRHGTRSGPPSMRQLGGYFRFDRANADLVLELLPAYVLIRRGERGSARIRRVIELIADEATELRDGRDLVSDLGGIGVAEAGEPRTLLALGDPLALPHEIAEEEEAATFALGHEHRHRARRVTRHRHDHDRPVAVDVVRSRGVERRRAVELVGAIAIERDASRDRRDPTLVEERALARRHPERGPHEVFGAAHVIPVRVRQHDARHDSLSAAQVVASDQQMIGCGATASRSIEFAAHSRTYRGSRAIRPG